MGFLDKLFGGKDIETTLDKKTAVKAIKQYYEENGYKVSLCRMKRYGSEEVTDPNKVEYIKIDPRGETPRISFTINVKGKKNKTILSPIAVDKNAEYYETTTKLRWIIILGAMYLAYLSMRVAVKSNIEFPTFDGFPFLFIIFSCALVPLTVLILVFAVSTRVIEKLMYKDTSRMDQAVQEFELLLKEKEHEIEK